MAPQVVNKPSSSYGVIHTVRSAIKLLLMVVFLGTLMVWFMMPTNTFRQKWFLHLRAKYNFSSFFGVQGATLLIYTFPILFIAVAACIYLHLGIKLNHHTLERSDDKKSPSALWRRPTLVKGPLGIVSGIELALFTMFIALLIWSFTIDLCNNFATITPQSAAEDGVQVWEARLGSAALRLGIVGNICLSLLLLPSGTRLISVTAFWLDLRG